jgi:hypothetical protein
MKKQSSASKDAGIDRPSSPLKSLGAKKKKGQVTFGDGSPQKIQEMIWRIVDQGGLVSFSKTSDGGALVLYVKDGLDEYKEYAADEDTLDEHLTNLIEAYVQL